MSWIECLNQRAKYAVVPWRQANGGVGNVLNTEMSEQMVYVKAGGLYHESEDCAGDLAHERPLESVEEAGIKPCGVCVNE